MYIVAPVALSVSRDTLGKALIRSKKARRDAGLF
jgi:hypothetical protein